MSLALIISLPPGKKLAPAKLIAVVKSTLPSLAICTALVITVLAIEGDTPRAGPKKLAKAEPAPAVIAATARFIIKAPASKLSSTLNVLVKLEPFHWNMSPSLFW